MSQTAVVDGVRTTAAERVRPARLLAAVGAGAVLAGAAIVGVLHVVPPTSAISPLRRTISEYGLTSLAWAFNLAVVLVVLGSLAVFAALAMRARLGPGAAVFGTFWLVGMSLVVVFPKHNWALGGSGASGDLHRLASLVAFLALPVAVLLVAARAGVRRSAARWALGLGVASLLWFAPIVYGLVVSSRAWWQAIPLGLVERGLALTEILALVALAFVARQRA